MSEPTENEPTPRRALPEGLSVEQIRRYIDRREQDMKVIHTALLNADARTIREITHKLKGNAALYGMDDFGLAAAKVLNATEGEDWKTMNESVEEMERILNLAKERYPH